MRVMFVLMSLIPLIMLLTVSFFVLFAVAKAEHQGLKSFGKVIAVLLWLVAAFVLCGGIMTAAHKGPMMHGMWGPGMMMQHMMEEKMDKQSMDKEKERAGELNKSTTVPMKK